MKYFAQASNKHSMLTDFEDNWVTKLLLRYELAKQRKDLKVRAVLLRTRITSMCSRLEPGGRNKE